MVDTARSQQEKIQYFDPPHVLQEKVEAVAKLITKSKHFIAFTGAGISTSSGIPDFRSGTNTILKTGAGVWEKRAQGVKQTEPNKNIVDRNRAIPSFTHMSLVALEKANILKFLVSQNTDGLHLRSQFNVSKMAQLHGNRMLEKCKNCKSRFLRDFITRQAKKALDHETSRKCERCHHILYDSIINFGENLPAEELDRSLEEAKCADVCLAMGSSLTVNPAAQIPKQVGVNGKLIIVNLQKTPLDKFAFIKVNAMCDDFMKLLMQKLKIEVEEFLLHRLIQFKNTKDGKLTFRGIDRRGIPFTYLKSVSIWEINGDAEIEEKVEAKQPYLLPACDKNPAKINLQFYGWLQEPPLEIRLEKAIEGVMQLVYNPLSQEWRKPEWVKNFKYKE